MRKVRDNSGFANNKVKEIKDSNIEISAIRPFFRQSSISPDINILVTKTFISLKADIQT